MLQFAEVLGFFLDLKNRNHWAKVQELVARNDSAADKTIREYVLEAQRLTSKQRNLRICAQPTTVKGHGNETKEFKAGDVVVCFLVSYRSLSNSIPSNLTQGPACMDGKVIENPTEFKPGRPANAYIHFGYGPHECLGREIALTYLIGMIKLCAGLKNLRRAPGSMGLCKSIQIGQERSYLNDSWSYLTFDPTSESSAFPSTLYFSSTHTLDTKHTRLTRDPSNSMEAPL